MVNLSLKYIGIWVLLYCSKMLPGQCVSEPYAYRAGEKISYEVAYNWGVVWVDAGTVYFKVDTVVKNGQEMFLFDSYGESYKFYDWFYKVRDRFQSVVLTDGYHPLWFSRVTNEGGYWVSNRYDFFPENHKVICHTENSNKPLSIDTIQLVPCTFDVLSAIYYARTFDLANLEAGEKNPIHFLIDGEYQELYIRYLGQEIKQLRNGKKYNCNVFSAMLVEGTIFSEGEDMVVWITADLNRIPVMVEAKILIGSVKAYLTGYENLLTELIEAE